MLTSLLVVAALAAGQVAPSPRFGAPIPTMVPESAVPTVPAAPEQMPAREVWLNQYKAAVSTVIPAGGDGRGDGVNDSKAGNDKNGSDKNGKDDADQKTKKDEPARPGFCYNFMKAYCDEFFPKKDANCNGEQETPPAPRRALPEPWSSPPFPGHEYQGYPLVGVPPAPLDTYPLMKGLLATPVVGDWLKDERIKIYGWITTSGNWGTATNTNTPASYWIVPNHYELDQAVLRFEREEDTVQRDHMDWGFRLTGMYGIDYRYTNAGGWGNEQLTSHNLLNGFDPIEVYFDWYIPWIAEGCVIRVGRWVACPDIETQLAPDNYLGSHSLLFTYDTYTQTGVMATFKLTDQWMVQGAIQSGTDMAPWYQGATPTGFFGVRWVSKDNNDAFYTCLNNINNAHFRYFVDDNGQLMGHDNFNYIVTTWEHRFTPEIHTKTESYYMWESNAVVGGTPSSGPIEPYGGGGGIGANIPGMSRAYGVLNYTMFAFTKSDFFTVRNEWWRDETGFRSGFAGNYTSHTVGITHNFNSVFQIRPEIGYYRNWTQPAFDNGTTKGCWIYGFDMTIRF